jgi:hypothetical protein
MNACHGLKSTTKPNSAVLDAPAWMAVAGYGHFVYSLAAVAKGKDKLKAVRLCRWLFENLCCNMQHTATVQWYRIIRQIYKLLGVPVRRASVKWILTAQKTGNTSTSCLHFYCICVRGAVWKIGVCCLYSVRVSVWDILTETGRIMAKREKVYVCKR